MFCLQTLQTPQSPNSSLHSYGGSSYPPPWTSHPPAEAGSATGTVLRASSEAQKPSHWLVGAQLGLGPSFDTVIM